MQTFIAVLSLLALGVGVAAQEPKFDVVSIRHAPGFRWESSRTQVQVLVVDRIERPTPN